MLKSKHLLFLPLLAGLILVSFDVSSPPPQGAIGPYLDGVFAPSAPGGAWALEDPLPGESFPAPVRIVPFPGTSDLLVLSKIGQIWRVSLENGSKELILDITDRSFKLGDGGTLGIALHPRFGDLSAPDKQLVFVYYRSKPEPDEWSEKGFNRLSKFSWDAQAGIFDPASEEILIQQYDRSTWHNGGAMFFGPDGFLYLSVGDEGFFEFQPVSTQTITGGFFSGILRIDVDNDPDRSHPIRRQPLSNEAPPAGWGETFSRAYSIPDDNPWLDPEGGVLEEFFAIGIRSPYAMSYDPEKGLIWVADVGAGQREEISLVEKGDNCQWPYLEGTFVSEDRTKPDSLIGNEKGVYLEYDRSFGACVIGGDIYRGTVFPELNEKYIFGDCVSNRLMALTQTGSQSEPEMETLIADLGGEPVEIPRGPITTGVFPLPNGQIFFTVIGSETEDGAGKIFRLKRKAGVADPPARLSELGAFTDLTTLNPAPGLIPYRVNAPLWSDRAIKKRWMAIPNDGTFDSPEEQVIFRENEEWTFPEGAVFVKHFELPRTLSRTGETIRLETRFFIIGKDRRAYGLTYKWNEEGTEAFLLGGGASKGYDIYEGGSVAFTQDWDYPSREQCMSCHNANANYVLGVKTHQLNGENFYPELGRSMNQLEYLNQIGVFQRNIGQSSQYLRSYPIDDESIDLGLRVRSYLDANCAGCHRQGGVAGLSMDLRLNRPLPLQNIINVPTQSHSSDPNQLIVKPGDHQASVLWTRDASLTDNRMPPISRNMLDQVYLDALAEWIDNLPGNAGTLDQNLVFPNPSKGRLGIRISENWEAPYRLSIYNMSGQLMRKETLDSRARHLDLTDLPAGVYVLELRSGDQREIKRFVLNE